MMNRTMNVTSAGSALDRVVLRWPSAEAREWAHEFIPSACDDLGTLAVVVFGSSVRAVQHSADLDLLIVYRMNIPAFHRAPLDVDVRGYSADDVERLINGAHDLLGWALRLGVLVCEREAFWTSLRHKWQDSAPMPSAQLALQRALKSEILAQDLRKAGDHDAAFEQRISAATHRARARLLGDRVFPASRPELPAQLESIGEHDSARELRALLSERSARAHDVVVPSRATK